MTLPGHAHQPAPPAILARGLASLRMVCAIVAVAALAAATPAWAKPAQVQAPAGDIATTIMANPHYAMAAKAYARRRGYQAERPVASRSNFLPVVSLVAAAATGVTLAAKGAPASQ